MDEAFNYIKRNGIATLSAYPYSGRQTSCAKSRHARSSIKVSGFRDVPASESSLQAAVGKRSSTEISKIRNIISCLNIVPFNTKVLKNYC